jgi:hypothetical protein
MISRPLIFAVVLAAAGGCAHDASIGSGEQVDDRSGISVGALREPIEFVESEGASIGRRSSFAYLGPVEWDRMGEIRYALWIHVAPGNDKQVADIRGASAVRLVLEDGPWDLAPLADPPALGREPYPLQVTWGQAAYFAADADGLRRLAAQRIVALDLLGVDGTPVHFKTALDTRPTMAGYVQDRGIAAAAAPASPD